MTQTNNKQRNTAILVTLLLSLTTPVSAELQIQTFSNNTTATPGNTTQTHTIQITETNQTQNNINTKIQFPFNTTLQPQTINTLQPGQSKNITLQAEPSRSTPPQTTTQTLTATGNRSDTARTQITLDIPRVTRWETGKNQVNSNLSVGSSGTLTTLTINGTGNTDTTIQTQAQGNLTRFIDTRETVPVFPEVTSRLPINYAIPQNTGFGNYTANLTVTGGGQNQTIPIKTRFLDEIPPQILETDVPDIQATQTQTFEVRTEDNLNVSQVTGQILKENTVQRNNSTVTTNNTVQTVEFQQQSENSKTWRYTVEDTDTEGTYYINITSQDRSGNTDTRTQKFQITRLNVTEILNQNFQFQSTQPDKNTEKPLFRSSAATPINITLERFDYDGNTSSIEIGVKKPGDTVPTKYSVPGDTITVEDSGTAQLVVESNEVQEYSGQLTLEPVPQAEELPDIVFSGEFIDPVYPAPQNYSLGRFEGTVRYSDNQSAEKQEVVLRLKGSAEECRGFDKFEECINGFSLGEIPSLKEETQRTVRNAEFQRNLGIGFGTLSILVIGLYFLKERQKGRHVFVEQVEKQ